MMKAVLGLKGIRVIQTATVWAGPMAARLLADLGADVIVVEPIKGESSRIARDRQLPGENKPTLNLVPQNYNRNKRGIAVDLSHDNGKEILYRLLKQADVLVSNFRPREIQKFQLEPATLRRLNRRLIHANLTGYGKSGPDKDLPAYGNLGVCRSGLQHLVDWTGDPVVVPYDLPDNMTGLALAYGIMAALFIRERTGIGQQVDTSLFSTMVFAISAEIADTLISGKDQQKSAREDSVYPLRNYYETKDGRWLRLSTGGDGDQYWPGFCRAIGREDIEHDPRFELSESRMKNHVALFRILEEAFLARELAEWKIPLNDAKIPYAPVQTLTEAVADPQARANNFFIPFDHPSYGPVELVANPVTFSETPETIKMMAPGLGEHTDDVLLEHGYTREVIARFREQHVVA